MSRYCVINKTVAYKLIKLGSINRMPLPAFLLPSALHNHSEAKMESNLLSSLSVKIELWPELIANISEGCHQRHPLTLKLLLVGQLMEGFYF